MNEEAYTLEKQVWSDADFEQMGWHDAHIRGCCLNIDKQEVLLDIDYIFHWVTVHGSERTHFRFWVAPVTMVFENAYKVLLDWDAGYPFSDHLLISLDRIERSEEHTWFDGTKSWLWTLDGLQGGNGSLRATGYKMYVRRAPIYGGQKLDYDKRGGISFAREYRG